MKIQSIFFFIPTILSFHFFHPKSLDKPLYISRRYFENYNHLDANNLEKIEKMFYLKNSRYSPFRNMIHLKYVNGTNNLNMTDINKNNRKYVNITHILRELTNEADYENKDEDDDYNEFINPEKKHELPKNGFIDAFGIFRYNRDSGFSPPSHNRNSPSSNNDFSNDNQFEIIKSTNFSFKNVGGYEKIKSELMQTSDILCNYQKYEKYNVRTPKGIIFEGPPGNGKTLMAKGFSGEINASFIPVSGSEFSEKFVGVGASRVRDLFKLASNNKPCIIFIDEIDAVARKRGNDAVSSNSEKDQTLNQLLINLDGYKNSEGIFLIGATNRIDLLDPALIRPGRIDKHIYIGNPDSKTREEIIKIHSKGKPMESMINIDYIVDMTGGMSGAQIENLLNESMLKALREGREEITLDDLEFITNRIIAGWQATENKFSDEMINRIIIHEMGHAIIGFLSPEHSKLVKVTLNLWSPKTPGYTVFDSNDQDINIYTKNGLIQHLMVLLGGRIAEEVFYGYSVTTGAKKDLEEAFRLAQNMIVHYGMGHQNIYPDLSDQSKYLIDQEINSILLEANTNALKIIQNTKDIMSECAIILKKNNILKPDDIINVINKNYSELWKIYDIPKKRGT
jgi:cell division protease FtsH